MQMGAVYKDDGDKRNAFTVLIAKSERELLFGRSIRRSECNNEIDLK
jgi:hypothetical protein